MAGSIIVKNVIKDSEAHQKGVQPGWIIFSINKRVVDGNMNPNDIKDLLKHAKLPTTIDFLFVIHFGFYHQVSTLRFVRKVFFFYVNTFLR